MTEEELQKIEARLKAAEPSPWKRSGLTVVVGRYMDEGYVIADCGHHESPDTAPDNATFIAHAPTDIAALIAEVRRLRAIVEDYDIRPDC